MTKETPKRYPAGTHPNSLAALTSTWDSDKASDAQLKSAKSRTENANRRNEIRAKLKLLKSMEEELREDKLDSVDVLRLIAYDKMEDGDMDTAIEIFKSIAEFEKPKLARIESKIEEIKADTLTDEELMERIKSALKD